MKRIIRIILKYLLGAEIYARFLGVTIGKNCRIYIKAWGTEPFLIKIGHNVTITSGVRILTHDGTTCLIKNENGDRYQKYAKVNIGDNVFIGINSIIMPGVSIGSNVIIGAGSVVTKSIGSGVLVGGNPAKVICEFSHYEQKVRNGFVNNSELVSCSTYSEKVLLACKLYEERN